MMTQDFIHGDPKKSLAAMTLPLMVAMVLNMAYNLVDSLWIGNLLGETAYAALTNATPVILILNAIAMGATNGVAILLSQAVGAKNQQRCERLITTSLIAAVVFALAMTLLLELVLDPVLTLLQTPTEIFALTKNYLAIYLLGYLPVFLYCYFAAVMRSYGNSLFQVIAMLICTVLNAGLDPLFIHIMGFSGAAVATLLSQTFCLFVMLVYLHRKPLFHLHVSQFTAPLLSSFVAKGVPAAFQQSIPAISTTFLTALISGYGLSALAAYGITGKLEIILFYPAMALNMALTSIVGQCIGGKRTDRAICYLKLALGYGSIALIVLSVLVICFANPLSHLFVDSDAAAAIVSVYFKIVGIGYVLNTATNCYLGSLNGLGQPTKSMLCMVLYYLIVRMPLAWLFAHLGFGLNGIWIAFLISHIAAALAAALIANHALRQSERNDVQQNNLR